MVEKSQAWRLFQARSGNRLGTRGRIGELFRNDGFVPKSAVSASVSSNTNEPAFLVSRRSLLGGQYLSGQAASFCETAFISG